MAGQGAWAEAWTSTPEDGDWGSRLDEAGLAAFAFGPIVHAGRVHGGVVVGTRDPGLAQRLVENVASVVDFSTTPSALLGERLHGYLQSVQLWNSITQVLADSAFHPVFQPIIELASGDVVGYEALTRFASGNPPNRMFADARRVALGMELELATLGAAIDAARRLPSGRFLDLNVSPSLLENPAALQARLAKADRPIVLEITEHDAVADYVALREAIRWLGPNVRLAVDDAGAGIANFGHIVELSADFVKLDISLVRGVNVNLGRQALVVAMRHFARTAGCRLVAEGVETEDEARALTQLGVEFAQGFLFGRPEPAPAAGQGSARR
jgi:EAL domain-containing protein (putative c-di-GMP-specific phosphodiesterase class I)